MNDCGRSLRQAQGTSTGSGNVGRLRERRQAQGTEVLLLRLSASVAELVEATEASYSDRLLSLSKRPVRRGYCV